ncbi:hypothetical protein BC826DRAFT_323100 [Russula brevipes]|nr:hypothetical protein BC826DRAFT_323100 [Russula brevipes]
MHQAREIEIVPTRLNISLCPFSSLHHVDVQFGTPVPHLSSSAPERSLQRRPKYKLWASANMPPAQALVVSRPFSNDRQSTLGVTYVTLSISFLFVFGSFLACQFILRRRPIHDGALFCTPSSPPAPPSRGGWNIRKRDSFSPVSALVVKSTVLASSPLRLNIVLSLSPFTNRHWSTGFLCRSLELSLALGKATVVLLALAASASTTSMQRSFSNLIRPVASPSAASSDCNSSRHSRTASPLSSLRPLRHARVLNPFSACLQQPIGSDSKGHTRPHQHISNPTDSVADTDEPEPNMRVPDTINNTRILFSTDDAPFKDKDPLLPLIILSLPSSEHLVEDASQSVSLDENLLSPDGTFHSTRDRPPTPATADIFDVEATRRALTCRLRERRKHSVSLPSPKVLATTMNYWPRWF